MLDKKTLDEVVNKISELYRNNIDILNSLYYEILKLKEKVKDDSLSVSEHEKLEKKLIIKTKEYETLNLKNEGIYIVRDIPLYMYTDDMFNDKKEN